MLFRSSVAAKAIRRFTKLITPDQTKLLKTNAEYMKAITADLHRYLRELAMGKKLKKDDIEYVMTITGLNWDQAHSVDAVAAAIKKQKELEKTAAKMDQENLKKKAAAKNSISSAGGTAEAAREGQKPHWQPLLPLRGTRDGESQTPQPWTQGLRPREPQARSPRAQAPPLRQLRRRSARRPGHQPRRRRRR